MKSKLWIVLGFLLMFSCNNPPKAGKQVYIQLADDAVLDGFWLYLPEAYTEHEQWPVILFLNGGMGTGPDPGTSKNEGPARYVKEQVGAEKFIIINPHMKTGPNQLRMWGQHHKELISVLNYVVKNFSGNTEKVYLTGLSRGGHGSWSLAKKYPHKFKALISIAGRLSCQSGCSTLDGLPIWVVHNDEDPTVDVAYSRAAVDFLEKSLNVKFDRTSKLVRSNANRVYTEIDSDQHDAWNPTYGSPLIYDWLLSKSN